MEKIIKSVVYNEDNSVNISSSEAIEARKDFLKGFYFTRFNERENSLSIKHEKELEGVHVPFYTKENELIRSSLEGFFKEGNKEAINSLNFKHKMGLLLYGNPGTGKTSIIDFFSSTLVEKEDAIVLYCEDANSLGSSIYLAESIREIQDNPIVFVVDEFDNYVYRNSEGESKIKKFLDGTRSIDNTIIFAATNYLDRIPNAIKDRKSRFRYTIEILGISDKKERDEIIENNIKILAEGKFSKKQLKTMQESVILKADDLANESGLSIDDIKHIILDEIMDLSTPTSTVKSIGFNTREESEGSDNMDIPSADDLKKRFVTRLLRDIKSSAARGGTVKIELDD